MNSIPKATTDRQTVITLGFWSAILASVFAILFILIAIAISLMFPMKAWNGIQTYVENFNFLDMASFIPAFFLAPTMVILIVCINAISPESKKIFSQIGLAFTIVYAAIIPTNYYLQLFVVRLNLQSGTLEGLSILAQPNLHSIFFALETLGYGFLSLATIFVSLVFTSGKLEIWMRSLFIVSGAVGIFGVLAAPFGQPYLIFAGLGIWSLAFPISTILLSIFFRRSLN
ncbi:DUF4386 domain-containing protein [Tumidithrix helvetica PCC 7403]|uniref:hypothetical protein n=1 Tax=Tumidithrix helvetica TaxID=3457545 RepID=UPI003CBB3106